MSYFVSLTEKKMNKTCVLLFYGYVWSVSHTVPYCLAVTEMDALLSSQNGLLGKLKEECCTLGSKLEELIQASR